MSRQGETRLTDPKVGAYEPVRQEIVLLVSTDEATEHGSTRSGAQGEGADNFVQDSGNRIIMLSATILLRSVTERGECGSKASSHRWPEAQRRPYWALHIKRAVGGSLWPGTPSSESPGVVCCFFVVFVCWRRLHPPLEPRFWSIHVRFFGLGSCQHNLLANWLLSTHFVWSHPASLMVCCSLAQVR